MKEGMRGEEYQLEGAPVLTHLGRSLTRNFHSNPAAKAWTTRVDEWLKNT